MLRASLATKAGGTSPGGGFDETTRLYQGHRFGCRGRRRHCRAGHRAVDAGQMAKAVGEATDNKFQIQTFAAGEIVPGLQILDAVQNGTVELGHTASYYYFGKDPTFAFGSSVPFGPSMRLNQAWYMLGGGQEVLNEFYQNYNVTSLLAGNTGCQMGGWFRKEINTVNDLQGLKFRIGGYAGRVMQKLDRVAA